MFEASCYVRPFLTNFYTGISDGKNEQRDFTNDAEVQITSILMFHFCNKKKEKYI